MAKGKTKPSRSTKSGKAKQKYWLCQPAAQNRQTLIENTSIEFDKKKTRRTRFRIIINKPWCTLPTVYLHLEFDVELLCALSCLFWIIFSLCFVCTRKKISHRYVILCMCVVDFWVYFVPLLLRYPFFSFRLCSLSAWPTIRSPVLHTHTHTHTKHRIVFMLISSCIPFYLIAQPKRTFPSNRIHFQFMHCQST